MDGRRGAARSGVRTPARGHLSTHCPQACRVCGSAGRPAGGEHPCGAHGGARARDTQHRQRGGRGARAAREPRRPPGAGGRGRAHQADQPRSHLLAGRAARAASGDNEARSHPLSGRGRALHAAAPCGSTADHDPHARGDRWRALLPEALGAGVAGVRRVGHGFLRTQGREAPLSARQQPAHTPVARAGRNTRIPRVALARAAGARGGGAPDRLRELTRRAGVLDPQLPRLSGVRHRSVYLLRQGGARRGARAQQARLRGRQARRVLAARAAETDVPRGDREDLRQDGSARVRADRAYRDLR